MHPEHTHGTGASWEVVVPAVLLVAVAVAYTLLALRQADCPRRWSRWRTASFLAGTGLLLVAVVPLAELAHHDFQEHMLQHLLTGMYAPLLLVLGAPATLLLRSLPPRRARALGRVLRSAPARVLTHPVTALVLVLGGLYLLYLTPLYELTTQHSALHHLVHVHFLASGYLFAHAIAGPDPAPHRPSVPARLVVVGVAIVGHAVIAQLLYAGAFVQVPVPVEQLRGGADLMYYGGDIAELLLALAMVATWRPQRRAVASARSRVTPA